MNITITFRQMEPSFAIKSYAHDKIAKLQKFLRRPMTAKVTLSVDGLRHVAETRISSGGARMEAREGSDDMYASIDKVLDKLERQIRGAKGAAQSKARRSGATLRGGTKPKPLQGPLPAESDSRPRTAKARPARRARVKRAAPTKSRAAAVRTKAKTD
jgi:putative sigma-54 modulation protein